MKTPLLNQLERQIIRESKSLYAERLRLHIQVSRFKRFFPHLFARFVTFYISLVLILFFAFLFWSTFRQR